MEVMGCRSIAGIFKCFFCPGPKRAPDLASYKKCLFDRISVILKILQGLRGPRRSADVPGLMHHYREACAVSCRSWGNSYTILGHLVKLFFPIVWIRSFVSG